MTRVARGLVRDELRFQERAFRVALRVPTWALVPAPGKPAAAVATVTPAASRRGHSAEEADLEALRRLVIYLDRHRGEHYSVIARKWAVGGPGEAWADEALRRLATAGILAKRRGTGRANAPAWQNDLLARRGFAALVGGRSSDGLQTARQPAIAIGVVGAR